MSRSHAQQPTIRVAVHPGDVLRGDGRGIVVVPREHLDTVITLTGAVAAREATWRRAVADGADVAAATGADLVPEGRRTTTAHALP